jgi:hypothetical protein
MKYLNRTRKILTLPSGATAELRKLNFYNQALNDFGKKDEGIGISMFILTEKVGWLKFEGDEYTIVNKRTKDCIPGELSVDDLEQADAQAIVDGVMEFSGLTKTGREAVGTFPEKQIPSGEPSSVGAVIQLPSDRVNEAAAG